MQYTLNQLQIYLKVTQTKSITKASEELHLTQPAVSIQLKKFQDLFDIPLTEVVGRQLYITPFGKEIALVAEKIIEHSQSLDFKTMAHKGELTGRLLLSVVSTGKYVMPYFLTDFIKTNPGIELIMDVTNKSKVVESLENNEVDFALVSVLPTHLNIDKIPLMQNRLYLVANKEFKPRKGIYTNNVFNDISLIYREAGSGTRLTMERFIQKNKLPVKKKMELTSNEAVKQAVIAGLGCSIMPIIGIKNELNNGELQIIPVKNFPIKSTWYLIWMKAKKHAPAPLAFLHFIKRHKETIMKDKFGWLDTEH